MSIIDDVISQSEVEGAEDVRLVGLPAVEPCNCCGNQYDKSFRVEHEGVLYTFDCFECAIQALAPTCAHCQCRVIGHGVEGKGQIFCCAHCAREYGVAGVRDRAVQHPS